MRAPLAFLATLALLVLSAAPAFAHGEEGAAFEKTPARTLVQQALALLTQKDEPAEARERLEAALESRDRAGVDIAAVREALKAGKQDEHEVAIEHMNAALAPEKKPEEAAEARDEMETKEGGAHREEGTMGGEPAPPAGTALEHARQFEPGRGVEEWIALAVGLALGLAALGLLALPVTAKQLMGVSARR